MRSVFVKATKSCPVENDESKLSIDDMVVVRMIVNQTFFYDYLIPEETLELAMGKIVERYPEAAGRFAVDQKSIKLTNEGAVINFMEPSTLSLDEIKLKKFNYTFCWQNFIRDNRNFMHVPFVVTVQPLAGNSGMVLQFDTNHVLGDINADFMLVADFCSQVKNGSFYFETVIQQKRCDYFVPSGNPPKFNHPEFLTFEQFPAIDLPPENPSELTNAVIDEATLNKLKNDVYETGSQSAIDEMKKLGALPSTNDCLVALMHKAFVETRPKDEPKPDIGYPLTVALNLRPRRVPPVPGYHFGNMLGVLTNYFHEGEHCKYQFVRYCGSS
ncbi:uncharacterized protein LOC142345993 [Convolutriloba macropyga]|uniref:uncharacterized protein LOC142345993 n=1 Tax=Convolutriloba macropyga TaxID=536237 RepID=UPI003F51FB60